MLSQAAQNVVLDAKIIRYNWDLGSGQIRRGSITVAVWQRKGMAIYPMIIPLESFRMGHFLHVVHPLKPRPVRGFFLCFLPGNIFGADESI